MCYEYLSNHINVLKAFVSPDVEDCLALVESEGPIITSEIHNNYSLSSKLVGCTLRGYQIEGVSVFNKRFCLLKCDDNIF